jgi:hypothetical protein
MTHGGHQLFILNLIHQMPGSNRDLVPHLYATPFLPDIQRQQIGEIWHRLPKPVPGLLNVLLDLTPLPAVSNRWRNGFDP